MRATDSTPPVLWHYTFSNFNEKVRWALDHKAVPYVGHPLLPGSPRALRLSARGGTIPVLDLDGERLVDSTRIIAALERRHPEPALYPTDAEERRRALDLEDFFDENAGHEVRRALFWELRDDPDAASAMLAIGKGDVARRWLRATLPVAMAYARRRYRIYEQEAEEARGKVGAALDRLEAELGGGAYLVGDAFTVADIAAAALLYPVALPPQFPYAIPEPPPRLQAWLDSFAGRPAVEWIGEVYRRHRGRRAPI